MTQCTYHVFSHVVKQESPNHIYGGVLFKGEEQKVSPDFLSVPRVFAETSQRSSECRCGGHARVRPSLKLNSECSLSLREPHSELSNSGMMNLWRATKVIWRCVTENNLLLGYWPHYFHDELFLVVYQKSFFTFSRMSLQHDSFMHLCGIKFLPCAILTKFLVAEITNQSINQSISLLT